MHLRHDVRPGLHEPLVATLEIWTAEVVGPQAEHLQVGPHGAVEDEHPLAHRLQVGGGGRVEPAEEFRRVRYHPNRIPVAPGPPHQPR